MGDCRGDDMTKPKPLPEIKDCPWCGGKNCVMSDWTQRKTVVCQSCQSSGPNRKTPRGAINAWNRLPRLSREELQDLGALLIEYTTGGYSAPGEYYTRLYALKTKLEGMI